MAANQSYTTVSSFRITLVVVLFTMEVVVMWLFFPNLYIYRWTLWRFYTVSKEYFTFKEYSTILGILRFTK
jgi:hypothetical protein